MNYPASMVLTLLILTVAACNAYETNYMLNKCNRNIAEDNGGRLETAAALTYDYLMNCWTTIKVPDGQRIFMTFKRFDVEEPLNGVCVDEVNIYDGASTSSSLLSGGMCGNINHEFNMTSSGNTVTFHFVSDESAIFRGFDVIYVAYTSPPCDAGRFACSNGILCIDSALECDDIDQCGDNSDEGACSAEELAAREDSSPIGIIIGCTIGGLLIILIIAVLIYKVYIYYYWKNWLKNNQGRKYPWEENDNDLYRYPKTDKYQVFEIGKKGRNEAVVAEYFTEEKMYYQNATFEGDFGRYLDEK